MSSERKLLVESRDRWHELANHDKKQFLGSLAIAAPGIALAEVGIGTIVRGDLAGALEFVFGAGLAISAVKMGISEIQDFEDTTAKTAIRQNQIDELT